MRLSSDDLPMFFEPAHAALAERLRRAAPSLQEVEREGAYSDEEMRDRAAVAALAQAQLFELVAPEDGKLDARSLCLTREMLGYVSPRADSIFAVQGLGVYPLLLAGHDAQKKQLPAFARG